MHTDYPLSTEEFPFWFAGVQTLLALFQGWKDACREECSIGRSVLPFAMCVVCFSVVGAAVETYSRQQLHPDVLLQVPAFVFGFGLVVGLLPCQIVYWLAAFFTNQLRDRR